MKRERKRFLMKFRYHSTQHHDLNDEYDSDGFEEMMHKLDQRDEITRALFDEQIKVLKEEGKRLNAALRDETTRAPFDEQIKVLKEEGKRLNAALMFAFGGLVVYVVMRR